MSGVKHDSNQTMHAKAIVTMYTCALGEGEA